MKKILFLFVYLSLSACSSTLNLRAPLLTFVTTQTATIASATGEVRYVIRYKLADDAPKDLFAKIYYQDPGNKKIFHTRTIGSLGKAKVLNFNSIASNKIVNHSNYEIILLLYQDEDYSRIIGIHRDFIWFSMPKNVAEILDINLL